MSAAGTTTGRALRPTPLRTRLFFNLVPLVVILAGFGVFAILLFVDFSRQVRQQLEDSQRVDLVADRVGSNLTHLQTFLTLRGGPGALNPEEQANLRHYLDVVAQGVAELSVWCAAAGEEEINSRLLTLEHEIQVLMATDALLTSAEEDRDESRAWLSAFNGLDQVLEEIGLASKAGASGTRQSLDTLHARMVAALSVGAAVAVIIAAICCYFLARSILRPIHDLTAATTEISEGRLDHRVESRSGDELGKLGLAFNRMADRLQALRRSQDESVVMAHQFMEATIASFPDPVFIFDQTCRLELKNAAAGELLELVGGDGDGLPAEIKEVAKRTWERGEDVLAEKYGEALRWRIRGRKKFYLPRAVIIEHNSLVSGIALVLHDVTSFRLMDEVKSSMIGTVSHEIRTPLTSVSMVLHLLVEESVGPLGEEQRELVETALDDTERLMEVVNDLLDMTRIEQGRVQLEFESVDFAAWLEVTCEEYETLLDSKNQALRLRPASDLPSPRIDAKRLATAVRNLIENAHKYAPANSIIEVAARVTGSEEIELTVADEGPGIDEALQQKVFEKFYRAPGHQESGTGLGLSLVREIVHAHGGRISVGNRVQGGAEFKLIIPLKPNEK